MYTYVDSPNPNLICCVCRLPFTDPTVTRTCAHTFCRDCIIRAIDHSPQCPIDRSTLTQNDLAPANPIIRSLVDELAVECPHSAEGCMHTCQRQLIPAHLLNSCIYRQVSCPQGKCQETTCFKDTPSHRHDEDESSGAPKIQKWPTGKERSLTISEASTSPTAIQSELCSSTPSTERDIQDADRRAAAMLEQNILLRHKTQILEGLVHNLQRDMATVKRVLGPWFQANERATTAASHISTSMSMHRPPSDPSISHVDIHAPGIEVSLPDPSSRSQNRGSHFRRSASPPVDTLASYFPPELEATSNSQSIHVSQTFPARTSSGIDFLGSPQLDSYPFITHAVPQAPLVAPLNLSTTLEGTLHGLRESVVGLGASVDSMGRRHEIALAHETVRMAEEVGGLRTGIHGLRMQVHSIMMDRNSHMTGRDGVGEGNSTGQWMPLPASPPQIQLRTHHPHQASITKL